MKLFNTIEDRLHRAKCQFAAGAVAFMVTLVLFGCFVSIYQAPKVAAPTATAVVKGSFTTHTYPTGALLGPPLQGDIFRSKMAASATPVTSGGVAAADLMPVGFQQTSDCGPWSIDNMQYAITHVQCSPRATYVWSRQHVDATNWAMMNGTFAFANQYVASQLGQPSLTVWPYAGDINQVPSVAVSSDAATRKFNVLLTPDMPSMEAALAAGHPVGFYVAATQNWYSPTKCADGSYEIANGGALIGGHFPTAVKFDLNRKMMDGTTGGIQVVCDWGTGWAQNGYAWVSIAGWVNVGYLSQAFTLVGSAPQPLALTGNFPATLPAGAIMNVTWQSNGDGVRVSDVVNKYAANLPANGSFLTGVSAGDVWTFAATRAADSSTAAKVVTVAAAPSPPPAPVTGPLMFTGNFPVTLKAGQILNVTWQSNGDGVRVSDVVWKYKNTLPANGSFETMVPAGDVWTFTASRTADHASITKTVTVTP